jgi:hypothetical protein
MECGEKVLGSSTMNVYCLQQSGLSFFEQNPTSHGSSSGGHATKAET